MNTKTSLIILGLIIVVIVAGVLISKSSQRRAAMEDGTTTTTPLNQPGEFDANGTGGADATVPAYDTTTGEPLTPSLPATGVSGE